MARRKSKTLTEVELEFMQVIWDRADTSTEDLQRALAARGRPLTDGAIRRVLAILMQKGYLIRRKQGLSFLYNAKVQKNHALGSMFRDMLSRAFGGSGSLMIATFLDTVDIKPDEMDRIKRLIEDRERGKGDDKP
ncbi:MAG TPA: BlaI/MecI/CopY family transcriptional regulator [Spirochaetota bacterium]|nr:BlaI/MecI/CopY family transcriptional regulator [Spirochaetota bacterium]